VRYHGTPALIAVVAARASMKPSILRVSRQ
jgi:hypothetical protein